MRYKGVAPNGDVIGWFKSKAEIEEYIEEQGKTRGHDWRVGYLIRFRDGLQIEFIKKTGGFIKY